MKQLEEQLHSNVQKLAFLPDILAFATRKRAKQMSFECLETRE